MPIAAIGLIGGLASAGIGAGASLAAAGSEAGAAKSAAGLQYQLGEDQLAFERQQYQTQQANMAPFLKLGQGAAGQLGQLTGTAGQGLLTPFTESFHAPTAEEAAQTPGYQFTLQQGENALQNSAAAAGGLLNTGTAKGLEQYGAGLASTTYQQTYENAFNQYLNRYNIFQNNQANTFNRLASLAGLGQTSATNLASSGNQLAGIMAGTAGTIGSQVGGSRIFGGEATASGYAGLANAASGGINSIIQQAMLNQILQSQNQGGQGTQGGGYGGIWG